MLCFSFQHNVFYVFKVLKIYFSLLSVKRKTYTILHKSRFSILITPSECEEKSKNPSLGSNVSRNKIRGLAPYRHSFNQGKNKNFKRFLTCIFRCQCTLFSSIINVFFLRTSHMRTRGLKF